ncbi:hypothetical protein [Nocardioides sp. InS609-2]|uniref:hypothetical protein n=1 Tax=Nocardioides sp. InS609-2 TaxID=2760705 RepID=UPI0020BE6E93|nr:hypothetical protein [Nocardioides sp. InS609-2]
MPNPKKVTSPAYDGLVDDLLTEFPDLEPGSLFGMPCLKSAGKAVIGAFDGGVVFKLAGIPDVHAEALSLSGSVLFDPSGNGRPMKDWVVVTSEHEARWAGFAATAIGS